VKRIKSADALTEPATAAKGTAPCAPMRAHAGHPRLRGLVLRCEQCGKYLRRDDCLEAVVRLSHWLEAGSANLADRIRLRLGTKR
jgi:hypothetical protein